MSAIRMKQSSFYWELFAASERLQPFTHSSWSRSDVLTRLMSALS